MSDLLDELKASLPDRYRVERQVGQGGMATVFVCDDVRYGRKVAVKVLNPDLASALGAERFEREIQVLGKLNHPHILPVLDSGESHGLLYYVMPLVEGASLRDRLERDGPLPIDEAVAITCDVADALAHAHALGVIHRDIKPENILIHGGHAVVADFGIARLADDSGVTTRLTATGMSLGTAIYMSPEQASGERVDVRSDVYSLGCVLYEMLVGEPPFTGPNAMAIIARHTMEAPRSIAIVRASVPPQIENVVLHALEKAPADRFKSMEDFKDALLGQAGTVTTWRVTRSMPSPRGVSAGAGRRRALMVALVAAATVSAGAVAWTLFGGRSRRTGGTGGDLDPARIAVTYFDAGGSPELQPAADGLTESLIDNLSAIPTLHVVSRNAVMGLRAASVDSIGRALKVGSIITGAVSARPGGAHVDVRLVDVASNATLGSRGFDVSGSNVGIVRDSIASRVTDFLRKQLGTQITLTERRNETTSSEAWLALQRGERRRKEADSLVASGDLAGAQTALRDADGFFARAAAADGKWSEPLARRAMAAAKLATTLRGRAADAKAAIDSGVAYAERAIALDARNADALEARGTLRFLQSQMAASTDATATDRLLKLAEADLRAATALNPAQASAFATLSVLYYRRQSVQEANLAAQDAYRADAYLASAEQILTRLFWTSHDMENFADAERWCGEGFRRFPKNPFFTECGLWLLTTKYKAPYDPDKAWEVYRQLQQVTPTARLAVDTLRGRIVVAMVLARAADAARASDARRATMLADSARRVLVAARPPRELDPTRELSGYEVVARVFLHDYDEAVSLLEGYLTTNPEHARGFKTNTAWWWRDPGLQNHPRFKALLASIH